MRGQSVLCVGAAVVLFQVFAMQPASAQDTFSTSTQQTDPQSGQPVQGWRPGHRFSGSAVDNQYQPPGYVQPYGKPTMAKPAANPTPQNFRDNPESVYYGKASANPRRYQRQLPIGVPIQGTNSLGANATQLNGSANQNPPPKPSGHQSIFNLTILVPDATFSGKRGVNHYVTVIYPGKHPRLPGDNGANPVNTSAADVDVVDNTKGVVPITQIRASYSRAYGNRSMIETIYVDRAWTEEHPRGFKAGVTANAK